MRLAKQKINGSNSQIGVGYPFKSLPNIKGKITEHYGQSYSEFQKNARTELDYLQAYEKMERTL